MRTFTIFTLSMALLLHAGCGNDGRPADMPRLYPANIKITQEGSPLEGANVTLVSKTPATYGTASGTTDASGIAALRTYSFVGVPAGEYSVLISHVVTEGARELLTPEGLPYTVGGRAYQFVQEQYTREASTPHSLTIVDRGVSETFDVGDAVRVFLRENP